MYVGVSVCMCGCVCCIHRIRHLLRTPCRSADVCPHGTQKHPVEQTSLALPWTTCFLR